MNNIFYIILSVSVFLPAGTVMAIRVASLYIRHFFLFFFKKRKIRVRYGAGTCKVQYGQGKGQPVQGWYGPARTGQPEQGRYGQTRGRTQPLLARTSPYHARTCPVWASLRGCSL